VESSSPIFAGLTPFLLWFVESCISLLCRLDAKWRLTEDANATDLSHHFRPSESVVHDFVKLEDGAFAAENTSSSKLQDPTPKSRLLVYKNEDIFNPMKSRRQKSRDSGSPGERELSSSTDTGVVRPNSTAIGTFDITRDLDDRESSSSRISARGGRGGSGTGTKEEVHL
jgi:hypothetical protein